MRILPAALAAAGLVAVGAAMVAGAGLLPAPAEFQQAPGHQEQRNLASGEDFGEGESPAVPAVPSAPAASSAQAAPAASRPGLVSAAAPVRTVGGEEVAPPLLPAGSGLQRVPARAPLSRIALARPPEPPEDEWAGRLLPRPLAPAAGLIEAGGFTVRLAGIDPVPADERCADGGRDWACGMAARTAFRALLRGRSVLCEIADDATPALLETRCRIGKENLARWLIVNGWARALPGGPYAEQAEKARTGRKGIFGSPPETELSPRTLVLER